MLKYHEEPWPHYTGSLPDDFYEYVKDNWNTNDEDKKWNKIKNRSNTIVEDDKIKTTLNESALEVLLKSESVFKKFYPRLDIKEVNCSYSHTFSENPPTDTGFPMRKLHIDNGNKMVTGLWYFKNENEEDDGGHLRLKNPITNDEKQFYYNENKIILFPNTPLSWHYITDRKPSKYPRRFVCTMVEAKIKLHDYQTINGKDTLTYEAITNNYD